MTEPINIPEETLRKALEIIRKNERSRCAVCSKESSTGIYFKNKYNMPVCEECHNYE